VSQGRAYDLRAERPGFINPSPEPLMASIKLQEKLEDDIRKLVNLAVANKVGKSISAESKDMDNQGLEAGLSFIGMILENGERRIAEHWSAYEEKNTNKRKSPVIKYPDRYSLKTDLTRLEEAKKLTELMYSVPGSTVKRELAKCIVSSLLMGRVSVEIMNKINEEIDTAPYTTSDPEIILRAKELGAVGDETASLALGFNEDEAEKAQADHIKRILRIQESQTPNNGQLNGDPASRGNPDLSTDPGRQAKDEKTLSRETTLKTDTSSPVRGPGKDNKEED
jgi:hypothetical protein